MTTMTKILGIFSGSDPRSPSTWSGTPFNLIQALESQGVHCETYSADMRASRSVPERMLRSISKGSAPYTKLCLRPQLAHLASHFNHLECHDVLHVPGDFLMPFPRAHTGLRHHAFMDSTFRQFWTPWFREYHGQRNGLLKRALQFEIRRREKFYQSCLAQYSNIFVTTSWVRQSLVNDYGVDPERVTVCYTGTGNIRNLNLARDREHPILLFVAKHNYIHKGAAIVLDAFRRLREHHDTVELVMVGPDPGILGAAPNEPRVTFHSFLEWNELEHLFNSASVFVMPSLYEPYGLVYLEALRCGVPVVCSATGGMSSVVRDHDCGWAIDNDQPDALLNALLECVGDLDRCWARGRNGQAFVEAHCSWEICAELMVRTIKP